MAIMMWPCGWDGQKQATNFGQTWGQMQTRHTQREKTLEYEICSLLSTEAAKGESLPTSELIVKGCDMCSSCLWD